MDYAAIEACLTKIGEEVERKIRSVNCGGCGVYAVELAKRLESIGVKNYRIRAYGDTDKVNITKVEKTVFNSALPTNREDWNENGIQFHHVKLQFNNKLWDSEESVPVRKAKSWHWATLQQGYITRKALELLTAIPSNWNSWFDRKQIPKLCEIMDKHFAELRRNMATA